MNQLKLEKMMCHIISKMNDEIIDEVFAGKAKALRHSSVVDLRKDAAEILDILSYPIVRAVMESCNQGQIKELFDTIVDKTSDLNTKKQKKEFEHLVEKKLKHSKYEVFENM